MNNTAENCQYKWRYYINFSDFEKAFESINIKVMCNLSGQLRIHDNYEDCTGKSGRNWIYLRNYKIQNLPNRHKKQIPEKTNRRNNN